MNDSKAHWEPYGAIVLMLASLGFIVWVLHSAFN